MTAWKEAIESSVKIMEISLNRSTEPPDLLLETSAPQKTELVTEVKAQDSATEASQQHLVLKSIISFSVPSIKLVFVAEKSELNAEKGVFDPYDAGLFKSQDNNIESWQLVVDTKNWSIEHIRRNFDSDLRISLEQFSLIEVDSESQSRRFPWLLKSSEQGFSIDINRCTRGTSVYKDVDMTVKFSCGAAQANWKPKAINRLLRFLRLKNFKRFAYK